MIYSPEHFATQIRQRGFRLTPQRAVIMKVLSKTRGRLLPLEIFDEARRALPGITEPTLYRTLDFLVENGFVHVMTRGRRLVYELIQPHHYLLVCSVCGLETEMTPEQVQLLEEKMQQITGFKLIENQVKFMGVCSNCK